MKVKVNTFVVPEAGTDERDELTLDLPAAPPVAAPPAKPAVAKPVVVLPPGTVFPGSLADREWAKDPIFVGIVEDYPRRGKGDDMNWAGAYKGFRAALRDKYTLTQLADATEAFNARCVENGTAGTKFTMQPSRFYASAFTSAIAGHDPLAASASVPARPPVAEDETWSRVDAQIAAADVARRMSAARLLRVPFTTSPRDSQHTSRVARG